MNCGYIVVSLQSGKKARFGLLTEEIWKVQSTAVAYTSFQDLSEEYLLHGSPQDLFLCVCV